MYKRTRWAFVALVLFVALCIWGVNYIGQKRLENGKPYWPLGIDLQGGTELTYSLDLSRIERNRAMVADEVKDIIAKRLNASGLKEISVAVQGQDQLVIQLPGTDSSSVNDLKYRIEKAGNLTFRLVASGEQYTSAAAIEQYESEEHTWLDAEHVWVAKKIANPSFNEERPKPPDLLVRLEVEKVEVSPGKFEFRPTSKRDPKRVLWNKHEYDPAANTWEPKDMVSGRFLSQVGSTVDDRTLKPAVSFQFKGEGAAAFADLTGTHIKELLAIVLDDDVMEVATIQDRISGSGQLSGDFTDDDVKNIITVLRGGSLPTKPTLISESTVGSMLGQDSIESGLKAILFGLAGVMLIMAVYYMAGGVVANVALALNLLLILVFVMVFNQTLTLPGIAGMLLTLAMAVDANILIFERFREERKKGKNLAQSLSAGYDRAFWVIFDSNLTTIITGYVLFYLGTGPVKGFAITLISGIFASFFTSIYVTRIILSLLANLGLVRDLKMLEAFQTPRIPFVAYQRPFMLGSAVFIGVTWLFVIWRGKDNYGIDFTGGARVTMNLKESVRVEVLREKISALERTAPDLFRDYTVQTLRADETGVSRSYAILTRAGVASGGLKSARGQETKPAEAPPAPAAPAPAPAPAPLPPPMVPVPAQAPAEAPAGGPAGGAAGEAEAVAEPAQLVREALETMLEKEGWLLPTPFPAAVWSAGPGGDSLSLEVNLLAVSPEVTEESLRNNLNAFLEKRPLFTTQKRDPAVAYKGLTVASAQVVSKPLDTDRTKVTRYLVKTDPYPAPLPSMRAEEKIPTREQVADAIRDYFRQGAPAGQLQLAEPFPQVSTVGPRVASSLQTDALVAVFISIVGIVFYLSLRFEFIYGLAGIIALVHDCMVAIGVMAVTDQFFSTTFPVKLNLNELAAVLTIIGFSINDTIVLFDRIRENLEVLSRRKLTLKDIVDISVNQTLARTLWTSTTVFMVDVILLGFGGESVRGFAFVFAVGTVAGVYSSVFIAAPIAIWLHDRSVARRQALATAEA